MKAKTLRNLMTAAAVDLGEIPKKTDSYDSETEDTTASSDYEKDINVKNGNADNGDNLTKPVVKHGVKSIEMIDLFSSSSDADKNKKNLIHQISVRF